MTPRSEASGRLTSAVTVVLLCLAVLIPSLSCEESGMRHPASIQRLYRDGYPSIYPPTVEPTFRWDFSGDDVYRYDCFTDTYSTGNMPSGIVDQSIVTTWELVLTSSADGTAEVAVEPLEETILVRGGHFLDRSPPLGNVPMMTILGVEEDGSGRPAIMDVGSSLELLSFLPSTPIGVGESAVTPILLRFPAIGLDRFIPVRVKLELLRYIEVNGHTCALFDVSFEPCPDPLPPYLVGRYNGFVVGGGEVCFDVERRCLVSGEVVFGLMFGINAHLPAETSRMGQDELDHVNMYLWVTSTSRILLAE